MLIYGINPVCEAVRTGKVDLLGLHLSRSRDASLPKVLEKYVEAHPDLAAFASAAELNRLAKGGNHQGVVADTGDFPLLDWEEMKRRLGDLRQGCALLLDGVTDPQNLGNMARSAAALGVSWMILPRDRSAHVNETVIRTSSGGVFHLEVSVVNNLVRAGTDLKGLGFLLVGLDASADAEIHRTELPGRVAVVVGGEGRGIRRMMKRACDRMVRLPSSRAFPHLNAATAGAICLYEVVRRWSADGEERR